VTGLTSSYFGAVVVARVQVALAIRLHSTKDTECSMVMFETSPSNSWKEAWFVSDAPTSKVSSSLPSR
jgi:hypothetical protein